MQLRFTSLAVVSLREDLHLRECAHAGRTSKKPRMVRGLRLPQGLLSRFEVFVLAARMNVNSRYFS